MNYANLDPAFAECLLDQYVRLSSVPPVIVVVGECNTGKSCVLRSIERELQMELQPHQYEVYPDWKPTANGFTGYMAEVAGQFHRLIGAAMKQQKLLLIEMEQNRHDAGLSYSASHGASLILQTSWVDGRFFINVLKDRHGTLPKRSEFTISRVRPPHEILARPA